MCQQFSRPWEFSRSARCVKQYDIMIASTPMKSTLVHNPKTP
jgi:hypothetical protein